MKKIIIVTAFLIMFAQIKIFASDEHTLSSAHVIGAYVSYNQRDGYRQYDGSDNLSPIDNANPIMYGVIFGKRSPTKHPRLRSSSSFEVGYGRVKDGDYHEGESFSNYTTAGALADLHILFPAQDRNYFIALGLGGHMMRYGSEWQSANDESESGTNRTETTFTPSVNIGVGMEHLVSEKRGASLVYNFRFWRSTRYIETGSLFPMGVNYREFFYSHSLSIQILLPGLEKGGRFKTQGGSD